MDIEVSPYEGPPISGYAEVRDGRLSEIVHNVPRFRATCAAWPQEVGYGATPDEARQDFYKALKNGRRRVDPFVNGMAAFLNFYNSGEADFLFED